MQQYNDQLNETIDSLQDLAWLLEDNGFNDKLLKKVVAIRDDLINEIESSM